MRAKVGQRRVAAGRTLLLLAMAWSLYALAWLGGGVASIPVVLAGNAVLLAWAVRAFGFGHAGPASLATATLWYLLLSALYLVVVALVLDRPLQWLVADGSLTSALVLSLAVVAAPLLLWRLWPLFVVPALGGDLPAAPCVVRHGQISRWRSTIQLTRELTHDVEVSFRHGLTVSVTLLLLALAALLSAGLGLALSARAAATLLLVHALLLAPAAHWLIVRSTLRAWVAHLRALRAGLDDAQARVDPAAIDMVLAPGLPQPELDAVLLAALQAANVPRALAALEMGAIADTLPPADARDQRSPLMIAATLPDLGALRALIQHGADVNRAHAGTTPLVIATRDSHEGRPDAVTMLLANGADACAVDAAGNTPLHHAARCASPIIAALLLDTKVDVDAVNREGMTALGIAAAAANWDLLAFLLEHRARPDVDNARPALVCAAGIAEDDPVGVRLLLKHRARVDARAALERTALHSAALAGHVRIVEVLLAAGADPNLVDQRGTTALMEAARAGSAGTIHALGKRKPELDRRDGTGRSALMHAAQARQAGEDAVRALLALGCDRNLAADDGRRAVDLAALAGRWPIVAQLDPAYPRPSSLDPPATGTLDDQHAHLLDALRFGHWNVADELAACVREWPRAMREQLYLALCDDPALGAARCWLLNHAVEALAPPDDGAPLLGRVLEQLPGSAQAALELLQRGAPVGGAGLVARVLQYSPAPLDATQRALVQELVARGADPFGGTDAAPSTLHALVAAAEDGLATTLLRRGCDPNLRDGRGDTPLHLAVARDAHALVRELLLQGANPDVANACGETPLGLALTRNSTLAHWLDWSRWRLPLRPLRDEDLPDAAAVGDLDAVTRLLQLGLSVDATDARGATALIRAAGAGHAALAVHLLDAGADFTRMAHGGVHALAAAVSARREAIVRTLLSHGVSPDLRIAGIGTSLTLACALGEARIVEALLEAGADPEAADAQGGTPLHAIAQYAFGCGDVVIARSMFERLLRAGAKLTTRNRGNQDALLILLGAREPPGARCDAEALRLLCDWLVDRGAPVDTQDARGVGALHACALHGLIGCVRVLKARGAPLDLVDAFGRTAAQVASLIGYVDVAAELGLGGATIPGPRQTLRNPARAPD